MLNPATFDITVHQGATFELDVQYLDGDDQPVDMTGYVVEAQLWDRLAKGKLADFDTPWEDQEQGKFKLRLASAVTQAIDKQAQYDVLITEPSGDKFYLLQGAARLDPGLTGL